MNKSLQIKPSKSSSTNRVTLRKVSFVVGPETKPLSKLQSDAFQVSSSFISMIIGGIMKELFDFQSVKSSLFQLNAAEV